MNFVSSEQNILKAAVIGIGNMGRNHLRVLKEIEDVRVVAVADSDEPALGKVASYYGINTYTDYRRMLEKEKPQLVSIAIPTERHAEVACDAISYGANVLIEKPMAMNCEEGQQIIDIAKNYKAKLMVGHIERFNPAVVEVKKRLENNELGRIFQVHARRLSPYTGRILGVGVVFDLASHDIDVMRYLICSEVDRVYAEIERKVHDNYEDMLSGLLRFKNGTVGVLDVNWITPTKVRQLTVLGERGMYLVDYLTQDVFWYQNRFSESSWGNLSMFRGMLEGDMVKIHIQKKEPLRAELESFIMAVRNNEKPLVDGEDGVATLKVVQKLIESGNKHIPVYIQ